MHCNTANSDTHRSSQNGSCFSREVLASYVTEVFQFASVRRRPTGRAKKLK